jgi:hypothetical protein
LQVSSVLVQSSRLGHTGQGGSVTTAIGYTRVSTAEQEPAG